MKQMKLTALLISLIISICACSTQAAYKVSSELTSPYTTDSDNRAKDDEHLQTTLKNLLKTQIPGSAIDVVAYNGDVLLVGQVSSAKDKEKAGVMVKKNKAVEIVNNYLSINSKPSLNSSSSLASKSLDRIKSQNDINGQYLKIIAVDNTVYILGSNLGNLTALDEAIKGIYSMDGVNNVVNLVVPGENDYYSN